jgi:formate-dependent nitrite reductase membrane component NrfD
MEHCQDHSTLVETVGEIKGTVNSIKESQDHMYKKIDVMIANGNSNAIDNAVTKTKLAPIFWVIVIVGGIILTSLVTNLWNKVVEPQQQTVIKK